MLKRLRLIDFKSFADAEVAVAPFTVLVGANASGKSNFLDAIRFLQDTGSDADFGTLLDGEEISGRAPFWSGLRGGAREAARFGTTAFALEAIWDGIHPDDEAFPGPGASPLPPVAVRHRIACETIPAPKLSFEALGPAVGPWAFETGDVTLDDIDLRVPTHGLPGRRPHGSARWTRDLSILWAILGSQDAGSPRVSREVVDYAHAVSEVRKLVFSIEPVPEEMRRYGKLPTARGSSESPIGPHGWNVSGALARMCRDAGAKQDIVEWLREICAPELEDLDFIEVPELGDVMAVLVEAGGRRITARSLSDGTLRFLGILLALRAAEPRSIVLLEDLETGLHPTRIGLLVQYIDQAVRERGIQVLASTHSPTALQWLPEATLRDAVLFARVPENPGTVMRRLGDLPHFDQILGRSQADIGALFATGWLERDL